MWWLIATGLAVRLALAFGLHGSEYDVESYELVAEQLANAPLNLYVELGAVTPTRWPYPTGYLPWIVTADWLAETTTLAFHGLIGVPAIAADAAIAWLVQDHLRRQGRGERARLSAVALVALGPIFLTISGYHGQQDAVAILPTVAAFWVWHHGGERRRFLLVGLLLGAGGAIKTIPLLLVLAVLPACRAWRQAGQLAAGATAVPFVVLLPWLLSTPRAVLEALTYSGAQSAGGISLVVQPGAAANWLTGVQEPNAVLLELIEHRTTVSVLLVAGLALLLARLRPPPLLAAAMVTLGIYVVGVGFFFQYLIWGLPLLLMLGHMRLAAAVQALAIIPAALFYSGPHNDGWVVAVYATLMIALWGLFAVVLVRWVAGERAAAREEGRSPLLRWPNLAPIGAGGRRIGRRILFITAGALGLYSLAALGWVAAEEGQPVGADGLFPADQLQYLAWVRDARDHVLASNLYDLAPSEHVFAHPMWTLSGIASAVVGGLGIWLLVWKPVAVAALAFAVWGYVRRWVPGRGWQIAALVLALAYAAPATPIAKALGAGDLRMGELSVVTGEVAPVFHLWGYLPTVIAIALMPGFLLALERILRGDLPAERRRRWIAAAAVMGLLSSWLHPWQGETLVVVLAGALVWREGRGTLRAALRSDVLIPLAATLAPLLYYFILSRVDGAWELAQTQNETARPALSSLVAALGPLAVLALMGVRRPTSDGERLLLLWPTAALVVYAMLSPSVPAHALGGISIPLAVLAARGASALRMKTAVAVAACLLLTLPGLYWYADEIREAVRSRVQLHLATSAERNALEVLEAAPGEGGVFSGARLGSYVPAATGRPVWVGHPSWTPRFLERANVAERLLTDGLLPGEARALVRSTGARFVLADCRQRADLQALLGSEARWVRRFGCAQVAELR